MMRKTNKNPIAKSLLKTLFLLFIISFSTTSVFAAEDAANGKELFEVNCASCHKLDKVSIGPKLRKVRSKYEDEWLLQWIKNNAALRKSGDERANAVYDEYAGAAMNIFANLTDAQILDILAYTDTEPEVVAKGTDGAPTEPTFFNNYTKYLLVIVALILFIVFIILLKIFRELKSLRRKQEAEASGVTYEEAAQSWWSKNKEKFIIVNPTITILALGSAFAALIFVPWFFWFGVNKVGVQQGYAPEQPINYSHKLHAGELGIDCQYCHSTASYSKSASIPSLNTCMNCHKGVQGTAEDGDNINPEIAKIYAALDYNPEGKPGEQYGPNRKAVKWVRIHNLPDLAYFNHSQHVKVGGLQCQECHGPIQDMEKVYQYSSLQMGWCIDCHRSKNIDVENNNYYEKLHASVKKQLNSADSAKYRKDYFKDGKLIITPSMNGGTECAKCHY